MLNPKGCLVSEVISGISVGSVQPPRGRLTLKVARGDQPCTWGPDLASEEALDRYPRVNTQACAWPGGLFSPLLSSSHPPALASGAALGISASGSERLWDISAQPPILTCSSPCPKFPSKTVPGETLA